MKGFCLEVSGPFACFTRPEMKVERVSYDVITPSAARAIFDAILWKPAIRWVITRIEVLAPIQWISVRRNEVAKTAIPRSTGIFIEDDRQQRAALLLRDVRYRLHGRFEVLPADRRPKACNPVPDSLIEPEEQKAEPDLPSLPLAQVEAKYAAMFERRARLGKHFHQPYLGCREFAADVRLVDASTRQPPPVDDSRELGWMLYDLDFSDPADPRPMFYRPSMKSGVIEVPHPESPEIRR
ncbi:MAG: CRISPR-associated protein, Cas5d family [Candidatus Ozemobacter sibiricus]|uniref:pre-crRNA processing endonuclease n=1 Tax=Candidatus Ozemobacter sibiricus TaxID=2268124 RepID=A0A367ZNU2_9BACT|nr:MAG: CRISPR-associated protein, Cas5d family [Candidatus Ozemobacter sibiricus]